MTKRRRVVAGFFAFIFVIFIVVIFLLHNLLTKSLPKTSGTLELTILDEPVDVLRDEFGVPHIFANNELDLFRAAGFVTAQDRLWQMDFNRRVASGRLSEILGAATLESDRYLRLWGFRRIADKITPQISTESRQVLEAYAAGINTFIDLNSHRLPIEFTLLGYEPEPWEVEDTIAYTRFLAWQLSMAWSVDLVLYDLVNKLGAQKATQVFPDFPKDSPRIIPKSTQPFRTATDNFLKAGWAVRDWLGMHTATLGSNSWVVSGEKSACGLPLLANDPHLTLGAPAIWYEMHLNAKSIDIAGVSFPGVPGVVIGHNRNIAWGFTNGMIDDADFYIERTNPENPMQYLVGASWRDFKVIEEVIHVKGGEDERLRIRMSRNGPVISDLRPVALPEHKAMSMRWTGQDNSDEMLGFLKIYKATNWAEFVEGMKHYKAPAQNFTFAAKDGDIGYYLGGTLPLRQGQDGTLPHKGWTSRGQWIGEVPFEKRPHVLNPLEGYIATANNKIADDKYPYYISNLWESPSRITRIHQLLQKKERLSLDDFKDIQNDVVSSYAQTVLPILLSDAEARLEKNPHEDLHNLYDLLKDWNCEEKTDGIETSIFHAVFMKLTENTLQDEMGAELYESYVRLSNVPNRVMAKFLQNPSSAWFDDVSTEAVENRGDIVERSFIDAAQMLREMAGDLISDWRWGDIHQQILEHPLGKRKPLNWAFNLGPFPRGGSTMTINNAEYKIAKPFEAYLGPSTRQLVDFCDINKALSVIPGGQSGQPFSDHYKDQLDMWLTGKYHIMMMDRDKVKESAEGHLILKPKS